MCNIKVEVKEVVEGWAWMEMCVCKLIFG